MKSATDVCIINAPQPHSDPQSEQDAESNPHNQNQINGGIGATS